MSELDRLIKDHGAKATAAAGWHLVHCLLDALDAPKAVRISWAGVGMIWSATWLGYYIHDLPGKRSPLNKWHHANVEREVKRQNG